MIKFFIKIVFGAAVLVGGSMIAVNKIPLLKANVMEIVNPRMQERELVQQLQKNIEELSVANIIGENKAIIEKSKQLVQKIAEKTAPDDGLMSSVISTVVQKAADVLLGGIALSTNSGQATQTPTPQGVGATPTTSVSSPPPPCR